MASSTSWGHGEVTTWAATEGHVWVSGSAAAGVCVISMAREHWDAPGWDSCQGPKSKGCAQLAQPLTICGAQESWPHLSLQRCRPPPYHLQQLGKLGKCPWGHESRRTIRAPHQLQHWESSLCTLPLPWWWGAKVSQPRGQEFGGRTGLVIGNDVPVLPFTTFGGQESGLRVLRAGELFMSLAGCRPCTLLGQDSRADPSGGGHR